MKRIKYFFNSALIMAGIYIILSILFLILQWYSNIEANIEFYLKYDTYIQLFKIIIDILEIIIRGCFWLSVALFMIYELDKYDEKGNLIDIETKKENI
jgi:hypothetical protein